MNINKLISIVEKKLLENILIEKISIEDKTFLHKKHASNQEGKYHLKLNIISSELKNINKIESTRKIYSILDQELKKYIHSIQILIS
tara:strand:- start:910 stop:1170 length:261 start_codon:yes stop_codon:yes gene_type:complete